MKCSKMDLVQLKRCHKGSSMDLAVYSKEIECWEYNASKTIGRNLGDLIYAFDATLDEFLPYNAKNLAIWI